MSNEIAETVLKLNLGAVLDRAARGEEIAITRDGEPIAVLGPAHGNPASSSAELLNRRKEAIARIQELGSQNRLDGLSISDLIDEGHRY